MSNQQEKYLFEFEEDTSPEAWAAKNLKETRKSINANVLEVISKEGRELAIERSLEESKADK